MIDCKLELNEAGHYYCPACGWVYPLNTAKPPRRNCPTAKDAPRPLPKYTTGTIMHDMLQEKLGVGMKAGCACKAWIDQMNVWGPIESRENLVKIVNALLAEAKRRGWKLDGRPMLSAAACVGTKCPGGLIFARAWTRKLVTEAINRSEQYEESKVIVS